MDIGVIITAGIGVVTTFCSGFFTWLFSKKKYNAEVDSDVIENLKKSIEVYETMIIDLQKRLDFYVNIAENNRVEMYRVKNVMLQLLDNVCTDKTCMSRKYYTEEEIRGILGVANGKSSINYDIDPEKN